MAKRTRPAPRDVRDLTIAEEELRSLTPEARIARLREIEEAHRQELEQTRRQVEEEIAAAEELIEQTQEEVETGRREEPRREVGSQEQGESLEQRLARERAAAPPQRQYEVPAEYRQPTPGGLYGMLEDAATTLERLYGRPEWTDREVQMYRETKDAIERARGYNLTSEKLREELGTADSVLKRLQYRR